MFLHYLDTRQYTEREHYSVYSVYTFLILNTFQCFYITQRSMFLHYSDTRQYTEHYSVYSVHTFLILNTIQCFYITQTLDSILNTVSVHA